MRRPFRACRVWASTIILVFLAMAIVLPSPSLARGSLLAQGATSQPVGTSTVTFGADWAVDTSNADPESIRLSHLSLPGTIFLYTDFADPTATDSSIVFSEFDAGFFSGFGDGDQQVVDSGMLAPSTAWWLYAVSQNSVPYGLLMAADVIGQPGRVMMSVLVAPQGTFGAATQAVLDTIDLNGAGSPVAGLVPAEIDAALAGAGQVNPSPAQPQPAPTPTQAAGLVIPPLQPTPVATGSEITVAGVTVRYGDAWIYDDVNSKPEERIYLDAADGSLLRFYGFFAEENPGIDAVRARDGFTEGYLDSIGATSVQEMGSGEASPGTAWSALRADLSGAPMLFLVYVDVVSSAGQIQIHMLVTDPNDLPAALGEAQASIQVNGAAAFRDLDPASVSAEPVASSSLPAVYLGTWDGTGTEADPSVTWPVSVTFHGGGIDEVVGTATYPTLACSGAFILRSVDPATGSIEVTEDITTGEANCVDGGTFLLAIINEGQQVSFTWTSPDGTASAEGILEPAQMSSQPVGTSTLTFSADWEVDTSNADPESIRLSHASMPDTLYLYTEFAEPTATNTSIVFGEFDAGFFSGFGDGNQQVVARGALSPTTDWRLYSVGQGGVPFRLLVTADVSTQPERVMMSVLLAPQDGFDLATQAVLDTVDLNGAGSPLSGIVPAEHEATLGGSAAGEQQTGRHAGDHRSMQPF